MMAYVEFDKVSFVYSSSGEPALRGCSFAVGKGEAVLLAGRSGCGKSTVLNLVNGLLAQGRLGELAGCVRVGALEVAKVPLWEVARRVGTVFQNPKTQFFNLDVADEILFGMENRGASHDQMAAALGDASRACGVEGLLDRGVFELSGGEKQRIACASAFATDPDVVVLDEPSANLDRAGVLALRGIVSAWKRMGKTILVAEHRLWYLADLVDRVLYLDQGRVAAEFKSDEFRALDQARRESLGLRCVLDPGGLGGTSGETALFPGCDGGLQVRDLAHRVRGRRVWSGVSLSAPRGRVCAITGPNGVGKSTLLRVLCGVVRSGHGTVALDGRELTARARRHGSFLVMQDVNAQLMGESVWDEATLGNPGQDERVKRVLDELDLLRFSACHPHALSGGQRQRLAVADCILSGRDVLAFDEPTSGLDLESMRRLAGILRRLVAGGACVIVVTHDVEFIRETDALVLPWNPQGQVG